MNSDPELVWLRHEETGHYWRCPIGAIGFWSPRGWVPSDEPPPELDPTKEVLAALEAAAAAANTPDTDPAQATAPDSKTSKPGKGASTEGA